MISTGIYVYVILPTCYVALPGSLTSISPISTALSNLRIATAGVYHNFILCFVIYLLQDSGGGVSNVMSGWAYQSVEGGLMITKIDPVGYGWHSLTRKLTSVIALELTPFFSAIADTNYHPSE